jgi:hypothetical protein
MTGTCKSFGVSPVVFRLHGDAPAEHRFDVLTPFFVDRVQARRARTGHAAPAAVAGDDAGPDQ